MKKTLLLSVVASTMIMAGGDIAPVEPVVETPVVAAASGWDFGGQAVAYTQTVDVQENGELFSGDSTYGALGLQLRAVNKDLFGGFGAGVEVSAIEQDDGYSNLPGDPGGSKGGNAGTDSAAITQAYLTYGIDAINTSLKVGRQTLPKSLSPFAFTEGWQVFKNTFDAALLVNSSIPSTTLVYAYVTRANRSVGDISDFNDISPDGVHMVTAQNKSVDNLTLTGTWYIAPDMTVGMIPNGGDANILWGDAKYKADAFNVALQGGQVDPDGLDSTTAWGAKVGGNINMFSAYAAYSSVDDGAVPIYNLGTRVKTPLYTQSVLDQNTISLDSDTWKIGAGVKALGGKFGLAYITSDLGSKARSSVFGQGNGGAGQYDEVDLTYKTKVGENTTLFAAYVYQNDDRQVDETQNFVRFWARYNFN